MINFDVRFRIQTTPGADLFAVALRTLIAIGLLLLPTLAQANPENQSTKIRDQRTNAAGAPGSGSSSTSQSRIPGSPPAAPLINWRKDTFAFSNDTSFAYGVDEKGELTMHKQAKPPEFTHRCFVLSRAVIQFHKFVRFEPKMPRTTPAQYRTLVRKIARIPAWASPFESSRRLIIPGYANLYDFSRAYEHMLKEEIGNWRPTFLRVGNWRMIGPFPRFGQRWAVTNLMKGIDHGKLQAVYITRFPKMNHVLVLFDYHRLANGDVHFDIYDPNYPGQLGSLTFNHARSSFEFPKRWFWTGGQVNLMRVYLSPIH